MDLLILGAGSHGRVVKELAEAIGQFDRISFLDDSSSDAIGKLADYASFTERFSHAFVAIGSPDKRRELLKQLKGKYEIPMLIHPDSYVSPSAEIGDGTVVMPKVVVQANVKIGAGCIVSSGASITFKKGQICNGNSVERRCKC